jgi:quercetin dioxygenase-like cupin family protein
MPTVWTIRRVFGVALVAAIFVCLGTGAEPDPKIISYTLPKDIKWVDSPSGSSQAVLVGDPSKPGLYVVLTKWRKGYMSRPHSHPNDRFITVLSGTWWMGWGPKYDPASTFPVPAGTFVVHHGGQIHYDGAKDEDAVLQIVGIGPASSTSREAK